MIIYEDIGEIQLIKGDYEKEIVRTLTDKGFDIRKIDEDEYEILYEILKKSWWKVLFYEKKNCARSFSIYWCDVVAHRSYNYSLILYFVIVGGENKWIIVME